MIEAVSTNGFLAALFGPGVVRTQRAAGRPEGNEGGSGETTSRTSRYAQPVDRVELSSFSQSSDAPSFGDSSSGNPSSSGARVSATDVGTGAGQSGIAGQQLTPEEDKQVRKLKQRDAEVRRHEQAHKSAAGGNATGAPTFEYQTGPDGKRYAVGGEVSIDTSAVSGDPQATIQKMQQIRRAALAPAQPSGQDRAVAAQAQAAEQKASSELAKKRRDDQAGPSGQNGAGQALSLTRFQVPAATRGDLLDLVA